MFLENAFAHRFGSAQNGAVRYCPTKRRSQRDHRGHIAGTLSRRRARNHSTQAVANEMNLAPGFPDGTIDGFGKAALDEEIRAVSVDADSRKIRFVTDARQPGVKLHQIDIGPQEPWDNHNSRAISLGNSKSVKDRRGVQQEKLGGE